MAVAINNDRKLQFCSHGTSTCYLQMQAVSTSDVFEQVASTNRDWLAGLSYCPTSLNLWGRDSLLRDLVKNELYNKYELLNRRHNYSLRFTYLNYRNFCMWIFVFPFPVVHTRSFFRAIHMHCMIKLNCVIHMAAQSENAISWETSLVYAC